MGEKQEEIKRFTAKKKADIAWISNMMGHADIYTTLTKYTRYISRQNVKRASFLSEFSVA